MLGPLVLFYQLQLPLENEALAKVSVKLGNHFFLAEAFFDQ